MRLSVETERCDEGEHQTRTGREQVEDERGEKEGQIDSYGSIILCSAAAKKQKRQRERNTEANGEKEAMRTRTRDPQPRK